jgi:hypothetical protein
MHTPDENEPEQHLLISLHDAERELHKRDDDGEIMPLWRQEKNERTGVLMFIEADARELALSMLRAIAHYSEHSFVCERCDGLFTGDYCSAANTNVTGKDLVLCSGCCAYVDQLSERAAQYQRDGDNATAILQALGIQEAGTD